PPRRTPWCRGPPRPDGAHASRAANVGHGPFPFTPGSLAAALRGGRNGEISRGLSFCRSAATGACGSLVPGHAGSSVRPSELRHDPVTNTARRGETICERRPSRNAQPTLLGRRLL